MKLDKPMNLRELKVSVDGAIGKIKPQHYYNYFAYAYDKTKLDKLLSRDPYTKWKAPKVYKSAN